MEFEIVEYEKKYERQLMDMEKGLTQGRFVKLRMERPSFSSRSKVFYQYKILCALANGKDLAGVIAFALTKVEINSNLTDSIIFYDVRVCRKFRGNLLSGILFDTALNNFNTFKVGPHFTTLKSTNTAIIKTAAKFYPDYYTYPFYYLTIPTYRRLKKVIHGKKQNFFMTEFDRNPSVLDEYADENTNISIWKTYNMYHLTIEHMAFPIRAYVWLMNNIPFRQAELPKNGSKLQFATAYDLNVNSINMINRTLERLEKKSINYLNVCCSNKDIIYNTFKPLSISTYQYYMICSFRINNDDILKFDVKCF